MYDERRHRGQSDASFTWWSWRPGIRPCRALLVGVPLLLLGVFFICAGIYALVSILLDSNALPTRIPGIVTGYTSGLLDNQTHLTIRALRNGRSSTVTPAIIPEEQRAIHTGDRVTLDYSPRLGYLYALEDHGQRYTLPGGSPLGGLFASIALMLVGLLFLPFPFLLTVWGWYDLRQPGRMIRGRVLALRATQRTHLPHQRRAGPAHPGLTPRLGRAWYGMVVETLTPASQRDIVPFAISEEQHGGLQEGEIVAVTYSPHLHYVRSIRPIENEALPSEGRQEEAR
ncbi:MAG TPA: hypothetical protein VIZ18_03005 [Ktedonobacteraceae bacterium]